MPTDQPSNVPDAIEPRDEDSAADVLTRGDGAMPSVGGGGLGGASAAGRISGAPGGTAPNAPIDTGVDAGEAAAEREARIRAGAAPAPEPHPLSG